MDRAFVPDDHHTDIPKYSEHYARVASFMTLAGQQVRIKPELPSLEERKLRARLILEEALETVEALGFECVVDLNLPEEHPIAMDVLRFKPTLEANLVEIADGCADISVVTTGTLIACGIHDEKLLREIDLNNIAKFGPGGYRDPGGKWCKPPGHPKPNIQKILEEQVP